MGKIETPYTVREVAALTGLSVQMVIRLFAHERGDHLRRKAATESYRTIRIPRHVYRRVI